MNSPALLLLLKQSWPWVRRMCQLNFYGGKVTSQKSGNCLFSFSITSIFLPVTPLIVKHKARSSLRWPVVLSHFVSNRADLQAKSSSQIPKKGCFG